MDFVTVIKVFREDFNELYPMSELYTNLMEYLHIVKINGVNKMFFGDDLVLRRLNGMPIDEKTRNVLLSEELIDKLYLSGAIRPIHKDLYIKHRDVIKRDELEYFYKLSDTKYDVIFEDFKFSNVDIFIRVCFYMGLIDYMTPSIFSATDLNSHLSRLLDRMYVTKYNWKHLCKHVISVTYMRDAINIVGWDMFVSSMGSNNIPKHIALELYYKSIITGEQLAEVLDAKTLAKIGLNVNKADVQPVIKPTYTREEIINRRLHPIVYNNKSMSILKDKQLMNDIISCDYSVLELVSMLGPDGIYLSQH